MKERLPIFEIQEPTFAASPISFSCFPPPAACLRRTRRFCEPHRRSVRSCRNALNRETLISRGA
eukprot:UN01928